MRDPDALISQRARCPQTLLPAAGSPRHHGFGFWAVAVTFMMLMAFTTVSQPSVRHL